ncbi:MAG: DUF3375 domain-containing protein, partial [Ruthenibacterium sp.]
MLAATRASFVMSFLYTVFVADNNREIPEYRLVAHLKEYLEIHAMSEFDARELLTQWAGDDYGWLRKFYPADSDEVHYDLTFAAQKAIEWVESLNTQSFVGTESRLMMVFQLFHEIVEQSEDDPQKRIQELERRKADIDAEIALAQQGHIKILEPVQMKERYLQAMQMSREILVDFRAVEQNFRDLRHAMQKKIAGWEKGKGELLEDFFVNQDDIYQSEQGKSFEAFYGFLTSRAAQDDFEQTVYAVSELDAIKELPGSKASQRIISDWVDGSKHVQDTLAAVSEQLRRYVDENFIQEERRINQIIKNIEAIGITLHDDVPQGAFMQMDALKPAIELPFDRPLFSPPLSNQIDTPNLTYGSETEADDCALYTHVSEDKTLLTQHIHTLLAQAQEVSLAQVVTAYPIQLGLAELLGYLSLSQKDVQVDLQPN